MGEALRRGRERSHAGGGVKIVCIGDSCTYGQGVRSSEAWPAVLERITGHDVRNAGVCGDTTRLGLERFPRDVQLHKPDVVVIQFGHNDANCWETDNGIPRVSQRAYAANIREMVERAWLGKAGVVVIRPHVVPDRDEWYDLRLGAYAKALKRQPFRTVRLPRREVTLLDDGYGVHPNPAMHERYAELVAAAL